jgi:hypothetical protein
MLHFLVHFYKASTRFMLSGEQSTEPRYVGLAAHPNSAIIFEKWSRICSRQRWNELHDVAKLPSSCKIVSRKHSFSFHTFSDAYSSCTFGKLCTRCPSYGLRLVSPRPRTTIHGFHQILVPARWCGHHYSNKLLFDKRKPMTHRQ